MRKVGDFFSQMALAAQKSDSVMEFVRVFCAEEVASHATFQMISLANNRLAVPYVKTTYPQEWISFYLLNGLMKLDPVVRHAQEVLEPFFWSEINLSHAEKRVMINALEYGISITGFTVPTADVGPYRGLFSFCPANQTEVEWCTSVRASVHDVVKIAYRLHGLARHEIDPYEGYAVRLSPREIDCLRNIAVGKTHTDMAEILGLSEHTVRSYCRALRLKLNCSTLAQAVAKACAMGLI